MSLSLSIYFAEIHLTKVGMSCRDGGMSHATLELAVDAHGGALDGSRAIDPEDDAIDSRALRGTSGMLRTVRASR